MPRDLVDPPFPVGVPAPPKPLGLWGTFRTARRNVLELIPAPAYREPILSGGGMIGLGASRWMMIMAPEWVEHVLKTRARDYPRSDITRRVLKPREGDSLLTAEWEGWRWQRRAMAPMFQPRNLDAFAPAMTAAAEAMSARIGAAADAGETADVSAASVAATFDVITEAALSGREALDRDAVIRGIDRFITVAGKLSLLDVFGAPNWVPRPGRLFAGGRALDRRIDAIIAARAANPKAEGEAPDLLDLLMSARDAETDRALSPAEQRNNLLSLIVAGHETTALTIAWTLYLLALDPAAQARARDEAQAALGDRAASAGDLPRLPFLRQTIDEALRLYPPAGFLARTAKAEDDIGGHPVRPGDTIMLPVYAMHRHRLLWDAPDSFEPDRFAPDASAGRHRAAFLPFGAGPKICIGMGFAVMEAQILLATVLARFAFALPEGFAPRPRMILTLRPEGGMPLRAHRL
ncbi:MAG: cytochrome P450 [Rubrimonas sp.]